MSTTTQNPMASTKLIIENFSKTAQKKIKFRNTEMKFIFQIGINRGFSMHQSPPYLIMQCLIPILKDRKCKANIRHRVSILDGEGKPCYAREYLWSSELLYVPLRDRFKQFASSDQIEPEWLKNDCMTLLCEVYDLSQIQEPKIAKDLHNLLENGRLSDVTLVIGEKTYKAHKTILAARSPVFAAMFEHNCEEKLQNRVQISDFDSVETFELFLRYLYTDQLEKLDTYAVELMIVADKYQMDHLKLRCENYLFNSITPETVTNFLLMADSYQFTDFKSRLINYLNDHCTEVMKTEGWKDMERKASPKLLIQLYEKLAIKVQDQNELKHKKPKVQFAHKNKVIKLN